MFDNEQVIKTASRCTCGAITVTINGIDYSMPRISFNKRFNARGRHVMNVTQGCNYCINHWGINLCACGSGDMFWTCREGLSECGKPMQSLEEGYNHVAAKDGWTG